MRHILSRASHPLLEQLARGRPLLAFDYDGTLAPIAPHPPLARLRPQTRRLLARLARRYRCVVISGRALRDLKRCLSGIDGLALIGNYGIEAGSVPPRAARAIERWLPLLSRRLSGWHGVVIEDKAYSVTVHYRHSHAKSRARAAVHEAAKALRDARAVWGIEALNLLPRTAPDKGVALKATLQRFGCDSALYVGDDDTDEPAFALGARQRVVGVRVGRKKSSAADYFIRNQAEIDDLLGRLLALRSGSR